jgi:hypothetical protein
VFGHKHAQTHSQQFRSELGVSIGALRRAAGHFAHGTAERLTPTYDRARLMAGRGWDNTRETVAPLYQHIRDGAALARAERLRQTGRTVAQRSRLRGLASLLAAGAAVGAAGAAVARRRRAQQAEWEEYPPMTDQTRYADESAYGHRSAREKVTAGAANVADSVSNRAGRIADSLHERSAQIHERSAQPGAHGMPEPPRTAGPMTGPSGTGPGMATPGATPGNPMAGPGAGSRDRLGDPALGFPDQP